MPIYEARLLLARRRSAFDQRVGQLRSLDASLKQAQAEVAQLTGRIEDLDQVAGLLTTYADDQQATVQGNIEKIVSTGLRTIFGEDLWLRIDNRLVGRRPELDFLLVSVIDGQTLETSILDARGGGVAAVAGFLIQAVLVLLTPGVRPVLFLDETFGQLSADYLEPLAGFIRELVDRSALQVVLVTHSDVFRNHADRAYEFEQVKGVTVVRSDSPC
jgi:DNA repair exonuclease SbcCD ATPase subunit